MIDKSLFQDEKAITVSIVTYNSADEIDTLMTSLQGCASFSEMTVYVVDNASSDDTVAVVKGRYPWARVIECERNNGFGRGHNLVIRNVRSRYHFIANPDVSVDEDAIAKAVRYLDDHPDVAAVTPYVRNVDGTQQFLPKKDPKLKYLLSGMFASRFAFCRKLRDEYTLKGQIITSPIEVEFCTGAFMCTRTESLHRVGGFDERYFLHFEDADLTRELRKVGKAVYDPDVKVTHKWHRQNIQVSSRTFWTALRSMYLYFSKWR